MEIKELFEIYKSHPVITTDSREVPEGSMFFALKGESFDGNKYAVAALEKGAAYAVVDDAEVFNNAAVDESCCGVKSLVLVDDVLQTFKDLAREYRRQFDIPVIGITGTNGKTTTKELVAAVLGERYKVLFTQGNYNNDVGVPKTLFRLSPEHEVAVVEMGASHPGDIKPLVETAEPTCGLITNVGRAHLQGFGSFEGVKATKGELYDYIINKERAFVFLNDRDDDLRTMAEERGVATEAYARGEVTKCDPYLTVRVDDALPEVRLHLVGAYNLPNILAAVTVGRHFGVSDEQIKHALENYIPTNNRSQLTVTARNRLVVDAYNANPTSMAAAIENFRMIDTDLPKMAILGDMKELGEASEAEHLAIVARLEVAGFDEVWLVGENFRRTGTALRCFDNVDDVKAALVATPVNGRFVLIKGSNSTKLFQLPELL